MRFAPPLRAALCCAGTSASSPTFYSMTARPLPRTARSRIDAERQPAGLAGLAVAGGQGNPNARLHWELIRVGNALVGINTGRPNRLGHRRARPRPHPRACRLCFDAAGVRYGRKSRIDLLLEQPGRPTCLVEVKNVTMRRSLGDGAPVEFPDRLHWRGARHLAELSMAVRQGHRAVMLYIAQRSDSTG